MRFLSMPVAFLLACGHAAAPAPTPPPASSTLSLAPAPIGTPAPAPSAPAACAPTVGPAAEALRTFRAELLAAAALDPAAFSSSLPERVAAFRARNRALLHAQAAWACQQLPKLALPDLDAMPDDPRVTDAVAARMRAVVAPDEGGFLPSLMGVFAADPIRLFAAIRGTVLAAAGNPGDPARMRENLLEGLAPAPLARLNDDPDHPVLALPRRADIFVVWFDHDGAAGQFVPRRIRWVRRDPPAEPQRAVATVTEAYQAFALALEGRPGQPDDTVANLSARLLTQAGEVAKEWLNPHAERLRAAATCACQDLPVAALPDLAGWKEQEGIWNLVLMTSTFPRLRWDLRQAFLFLRTSVDARTMKVGDYSGLALVDSLVPPTLHRVTGDCAEPTLFLVEGDRALVVPFASSPERGYYPIQVRVFRRE
jgi:hypothetical protein